MKIKKQKFDLSLLIALGILVAIGIATIYSSQNIIPTYYGNVALRQFFWLLIGFSFAISLLKFGNKLIYRNIWILYIFFNMLLVYLLIAPQTLVKSINGAKCWISVGNLFSFQPSEFMKIILIVLLAQIVAKFKKNSQNNNMKSELKLLLKVIALTLIPSILTFLEPDTGAVIIYLVILVSILLASGINKKWFIYSFIIILIISSIILITHQKDQDLFIKLFGTNLFYRLDRIFLWQNGIGMQLENSLATIGSGGFLGHGWTNNPLYFPEAHTDFIFAVYAGNFGLIGICFMLFLLAFIDLKLISYLDKNINIFNKLILVSIISIFIFSQFQNIAMTIGITPIMGIALPLVSYGGSSLLTNIILITIIINITNKKNYTI